MNSFRNEGKGRSADRLLLALVALLCGGLNWYLLRSSPFLAHPIIDAAEYLAEARGIVAGVRPIGAASIHGPVYPLLLAPILVLFGGATGAIYILQIAMHALSVLLVRECGEKLLGRAHGDLAGLLLAAAPPMLYFQVQVLPVIVQVFVHSLLLYLLVVRARPERKRPFLFAGAACGISWLIHPGGGLFVAILLAAAFAAWRRPGPPLLMAAGIVAALLPFSILRAVVGGGVVPLQGNTGLNVYIGNGEGADGTPRIRPGYEWEKLLAAPRRAGAAEGKEEAWYVAQVFREAARRPGAFAARLAAKGALYLSGRPIDASQDYEWFRERSLLLRNALFDAPLIVALTAAFLVFRRRRGPGVAAAAAGFIGYGISVALTVYAVRYRAPAWPFLALLAAGFPFAWRGAGAGRRWAAIAVAAAIVILSAADPFGYKGKNPVRTAYNLGRLHYTRGDFDGAAVWFDRARAESPDDPDVWNALGALAAARGDDDGAARRYDRALRLAPDYADARYNRALLLARTGAPAEAKRELEEAIRLVPAHAAAHYALGVLFERSGDVGRAESEYRAAVRHDPTRDDAWTALGVLLARAGNVTEAEECFRKALQLDPGSDAAAANLRRLAAR